MAKVILVDDEVTMVQMVTELLRAEGHEVLPFTNLRAAVEAIETQAPDLVITDLYLDKTRPHGLDILQKARAVTPPAVVIVVTGFGSIETAVEAMKRGAYDYLEKPFKLDELKLCIQRALSYNAAVSENFYLRKQLRKRYEFSQIVGTSAPMQEVYKMIERVADTDATILLLGESGTGKELVARALHFNSKRQFNPFVPVNCSALPEHLLESELFGHRKGAFTGAITDKKGLFQEADGGTILLDEVGSMPFLLQSRLLRVLQEHEVRRVGDNTPVIVNVRVVAATNESLEKRVKAGTFREDLFYRLNVIPIELPPLRTRLDDVPLLAAHFLRDRVHARTGHAFKVTRRAMERLCTYHWPGNVRELENALLRATALSEVGIITTASLPPTLFPAGSYPDDAAAEASELATLPETNRRTPPAATAGDAPATDGTTPPDDGALKSPAPLKNFLREQEVTYLNQVLAQFGGDKEKAAQVLGISLATLYRKLAGE